MMMLYCAIIAELREMRANVQYFSNVRVAAKKKEDLQTFFSKINITEVSEFI